MPIRKVRDASSSESPSARSTYEGSTAAEEHADPVETHRSGSASISARAVAPGNVTLKFPPTRLALAAVRPAPGDAPRQPLQQPAPQPRDPTRLRCHLLPCQPARL